jgi:hypothetical protein
MRLRAGEERLRIFLGNNIGVSGVTRGLVNAAQSKQFPPNAPMTNHQIASVSRGRVRISSIAAVWKEE